jgi:hypothetical protein
MPDNVMPDALPIDHPEQPPPSGGSDNQMAAEANDAVVSVALSGMAAGYAAAAEARVRGFDQLAIDAKAMWAVHMTTPTVLAGMGFQAAAGHMPPRQTETGTVAK